MERFPENPKIVTQPLQEALNNAVQSAASVGLVYILDNQPGYTRVRDSSGFYYMDGKKRVKDKEELKRIKSLVLPPAWERVWICKLKNGHLQATGYDKLNRKQYKYHSLWVELRNQNKYFKLKEFCEALPKIRENLKKDLSLPGYPQKKVLAAVVSLLEKINIRVGNSSYEKLYGSFGITTLKNRHVKINGTQLNLSFKGKKGIRHNITLTNKKLVRIVKGCRDIPGKELFEYYDENANIQSIDSGMVNTYIRSVSGADFTAKDFRTWAGTIHALRAFKELGGFETVAEMNRKIAAALDTVAFKLGNTRAVCKKYYVHPLVIELYRDRKLEKYIESLHPLKNTDDLEDFGAEESVLLEILKESEITYQKDLAEDAKEIPVHF